MWVMTFHSACARILRAEAERLGYTKRLLDLRRGGLGAARAALPGRARDRPEALRAARDQVADLARQEPARRTPPPTASSVELLLRADRRRRLRALREAHPRDERDRLRRPAVPDGERARAVPRRRRALPAARSAGSSSTSTRTPTTPSTACCSCSPARSATSASSATTTSRSTASAAPTSATSSTSSATSPARRSSSSSRTTAPRRRSSSAANAVVANNEGRKPKELWTDRRRGRARCTSRELEDEHAEARYRRLRDRAARATRASRAARSRSSTAPTRRAACWRTRSCASASPTR